MRKLFMIIISMITCIIMAIPVAAQENDSENITWVSSINWDKKSKSQLKKEVSKVMNQKLEEFATKWTKEFVNKSRIVSIDEIQIDLIKIAEEFHNLYASASAAYIMKEKGYFKKETIKPFPFDPRKETKKEFRFIGQYLYDQREGFKTYLSHGNRGIQDYLNNVSYEVSGGRKVAGGEVIARKYANEIVKRWENIY